MNIKATAKAFRARMGCEELSDELKALGAHLACALDAMALNKEIAAFENSRRAAADIFGRFETAWNAR